MEGRLWSVAFTFIKSMFSCCDRSSFRAVTDDYATDAAALCSAPFDKFCWGIHGRHVQAGPEELLRHQQVRDEELCIIYECSRFPTCICHLLAHGWRISECARLSWTPNWSRVWFILLIGFNAPATPDVSHQIICSLEKNNFFERKK